ncbi:MAG: nucleotidyltransferase family protein, partial [Chloroflexota bacterium]
MTDIARVVAVVLAAGTGSRFGGRKLLAPLEGRPVLQHVLDRVAAAGIQRVIVVVGHDARELQVTITWRDEVRVVNPDPARGLSSSLRIGMEALPDDAEAALIVLGDQPRVSPDVIAALLAAGVDARRPIAVPVYPDERGRNPVLLGRAAFALVDAAGGDRGLGPVLAAHQDLVHEIAVQGHNPDMDTR